jgi:hypothetical protein
MMTAAAALFDDDEVVVNLYCTSYDDAEMGPPSPPPSGVRAGFVLL